MLPVESATMTDVATVSKLLWGIEDWWIFGDLIIWKDENLLLYGTIQKVNRELISFLLATFSLTNYQDQKPL